MSIPNTAPAFSVNLAVCGRFHYSNYVRFLEQSGALNRFYYAAQLSLNGQKLGIPSRKAVNGFFKEYAVHLHARLLKGRWEVPAYGVYHELWQRYVMCRWSQADILHVMLHGNARLLMGRARAEGSAIIGEPVNCHPDDLRNLLNTEHELLGLRQKLTGNAIEDRIVAETGQCDHLLVASSWLKTSFINHGFPAERTSVLPYGIDCTRFSPLNNEVCDQPTHQLRKEKFRVICVAQISPRKGHVYLLEAWRKLKLHNAELLFVGRVAPEMVAVLHRYAGLFTHIPHVSHPALREYYAASQVFVLPSIEDGFGYVTAEAMACGLPVIATVNTGSSEVLDEGITGFKVPIRSPDSIAERIELLYRDHERLVEMGLAAREKVLHQMTWERYTQRLCAYYSGIFGEK